MMRQAHEGFGNMTSLIAPDWSREQAAGSHPGRRLMMAFRAYERAAQKSGPLGTLQRKVCELRYRFWTIVSGADIPLGTEIGGGFSIPHPNGIVINKNAKIGVNVVMMQGVTVGTNIGQDVPEIGPGTDIGPGARLLGGIKVGKRAMIGANAVVTKDVPDYALAVGVPAQIHTAWDDPRRMWEGQTHRATRARPTEELKDA
ncbi:MAG: serine acetyltransferase [Pseudomonadota bacterium]